MSAWIKICGTTNLEDALLTVAAGADALGFIFAPSPRKVSAEQVRVITEQVRAVERIGLFVNEQPEKIGEIFERAALTGVQLHGDEVPEEVASVSQQLRAIGRKARIIKTLRFTPQLVKDLRTFADSELVDAVLIDTFSPHARGGTGMTFDWEQANDSVRNAQVPIIIAGGLNPENVPQALATLGPFGVDATSGLEIRPGKKDAKKLEAFCAAVKAFQPADVAQFAKEKI